MSGYFFVMLTGSKKMLLHVESCISESKNVWKIGIYLLLLILVAPM